MIYERNTANSLLLRGGGCCASKPDEHAAIALLKKTYRFANGEVTVTCWKADAPVGEGAEWINNGQTANRTQDGQPVEEISLEEARQIAARVGVPAPFGGEIRN